MVAQLLIMAIDVDNGVPQGDQLCPARLDREVFEFLELAVAGQTIDPTTLENFYATLASKNFAVDVDSNEGESSEVHWYQLPGLQSTYVLAIGFTTRDEGLTTADFKYKQFTKADSEELSGLKALAERHDFFRTTPSVSAENIHHSIKVIMNAYGGSSTFHANATTESGEPVL